MKRHIFSLISVIVLLLLTSCKLTIISFDAPDSAETGTAINLLITATAEETGDNATDHGVVVQIPENWQVLYGKANAEGYPEFMLTEKPDYASLYTPQTGHKIWVGAAGQSQRQDTTLTFKVRVMTGDFPGNLGDAQVFSLKAAVGVFRESAWVTDDPQGVFQFSNIAQDLYVETITVTKAGDQIAPAPVTSLTVNDNYDGSVSLSWGGYDEEGQKDVVNYRIYMSSNEFFSVSGMNPEATLNAGTFSYQRGALSYGNTYYFAVTAADELLHENASVTPVAVTPREGGYISGFVRRASDGQPVSGVNVFARDIATGDQMNSGMTQADGSYIIQGLPERPCSVGISNWQSGYFAECQGQMGNQCSPVQVASGQAVSGIDFILMYDGDRDGYMENYDPFASNSGEWSDADEDGIGDTADPDDDNDGIADSEDNCSFIPNSDQADSVGNGIGDACRADRMEGFETGDFSRFSWASSGDGLWSVTTAGPHTGSFSAGSPPMQDNGRSSLEVSLACGSGPMTFWLSVDSEANYDYLRFYIDEELAGAWSGWIAYSQATFKVEAGLHSFKWAYTKDYSVSNGLDAAWVDDIRFPEVAGPDADGDGIPDESDAFPNDPNEWLDNDGDGIGNNSDPDDDNDGIPDVIDAFPWNPVEWADFDHDRIPDNADPDDDNDGYTDEFDAYPLNPEEWSDSDGDGIGDTADPDDDNDGIADSEDNCSFIPNSDQADSVGNGIGDACRADRMEDFETGDFSRFSWASSGDGLWSVSVVRPRSGTFAAESPSIPDNQSSSLEVSQECEEGVMTFWFSVDSEANYDFLRFYMDEELVGAWSGSVDYSQATITVEPGVHTFKWAYSKDYSVSTGLDAAWIDDIRFPGVVRPYTGGALKGDVNGDKIIDLKDTVRALQVISGINSHAVRLGADVIGDSKIGMEEVLYTLQVLSGGRGIQIETGRCFAFEFDFAGAVPQPPYVAIDYQIVFTNSNLLENGEGWSVQVFDDNGTAVSNKVEFRSPFEFPTTGVLTTLKNPLNTPLTDGRGFLLFSDVAGTFDLSTEAYVRARTTLDPSGSELGVDLTSLVPAIVKMVPCPD